MDWYPQQSFTAEQAAAGFCFFCKTRLFPQALFTAEQAAADMFFFFEVDMYVF